MLHHLPSTVLEPLTLRTRIIITFFFSTLNNTASKINQTPSFYFLSLYPGNYDKCVSLMMASVKDDEKSNVVQNVLSHAAVAKKNLIVIHLIVSNSCINDIEYYQRI